MRLASPQTAVSAVATRGVHPEITPNSGPFRWRFQQAEFDEEWLVHDDLRLQLCSRPEEVAQARQEQSRKCNHQAGLSDDSKRSAN